ncbi:MAG: effector binding domain-containing protein [Cloacibacterium sp.]|nr:effector binding domain-containing protein [Cloacibacterium sp.]
MKNIKYMKIIGISTVTTNANGQSAEDLGKLWGRFFEENISAKIPNKVSDEIYAVYTDYESNYLGKYTTIIGQKVESLDTVPENLMAREFPNENFQKFVAKGEMPNAVVEVWKEIWQKDEQLGRKYTYDYEIYGEKSQNGNESEVEIFIAV